jgi:hypothetical protein
LYDCFGVWQVATIDTAINDDQVIEENAIFAFRTIHRPG